MLATDIRLRPAAPADRAFLRDVYAATRAEELALVAWDEAARDAFLEQQFSAQDMHYRRFYPGATFDVVEVAGVPAGRLYVCRPEREIRIMDIALLADHRGRGIGTQLLGRLTEESRLTGCSLTIHVELTNRARTLYERLGFAPVEEHGVHMLMAWTAAATTSRTEG
jgi:GNAT superfamily N-acetyltransferase